MGMLFISKQEAILRMNRWGGEGSPFLFVIDYKQEQCLVERPEHINPDELLYDLEGWRNTVAVGLSSFSEEEAVPVGWFPEPISAEVYARSFRVVEEAIHAGNSYLVNLTCPTPVRTNLTLREIFARSSARYKLWIRDRFVVFSPEIFVRIDEAGQIASFPMKGTIDATLPHAARLILDDPKEAAEHATIVDLIRNDLSIVADRVRVARYRYIDELTTNRGPLLQVSSEVTGRLDSNWRNHLGEIFFSLLPAGSITGAPKRKTMQIIAEAEGYERGFYTGVMGYFDGRRFNSAVMIRFVEQQAEGLLFKSGGGITSQSRCDSEYNEMIQKVYVPVR